jgi:excisionase family DNA binding protein
MNTCPTFLTVSDAADLLRVSERTVREWIHRGHLRAVRAGARGAWRIPHAEIARFGRGR